MRMQIVYISFLSIYATTYIQSMQELDTIDQEETLTITVKSGENTHDFTCLKKSIKKFFLKFTYYDNKTDHYIILQTYKQHYISNQKTTDIAYQDTLALNCLKKAFYRYKKKYASKKSNLLCSK